MAIDGLQSLSDLEFRVPDKMPLIGCDDLRIATETRPASRKTRESTGKQSQPQPIASPADLTCHLFVQQTPFPPSLGRR